MVSPRSTAAFYIACGRWDRPKPWSQMGIPPCMLLLSARAQTAQPGTQLGAHLISQVTLSGLQGLATTLAVRDTFAHLRASLVVGGCREGYPPGLAEDVKANMTHLARMQHILFLQSLLHQLPQLIPQVSLYARPFAGAVVGSEAC